MTDIAKRPIGRRTKCTPETADRILRAIRAGSFFDTACRHAGVHPATAYRWIQDADENPRAPKEKRDFRDALERARAGVEVGIVASVMKAAKGGYVTKEVTRVLRNGDTETEKTIAGPDGRVGLEFLARAYPDRWSAKKAVEVTGAEGGPIQVSAARINGLADRVSAVIAAANGEDDDVVDAEVIG